MIWIAFVFGLVFGSFVNVVAYRVPVGKSIKSPPSACPNCDTPIRPQDNIPVLSWMILRGRCRDCREPISARYPTVEIATGVLFALMTAYVEVHWVLPAYLAFSVVTMALILTDLDWKRIPNAILFPGGGIAVGLLIIGAFIEGAQSRLPMALAGGVAFFAILFTIALITRGGMGMGDVKLALLLGTFTAFWGWAIFFTGIFVGFMVGGLMGVLLLVTKKKGRKDEVPFGPSLIAGAWIAILWGPTLVNWLTRTG